MASITPIAISQQVDALIASPATRNALFFDSTDSKWKNRMIVSADISDATSSVLADKVAKFGPAGEFAVGEITGVAATFVEVNASEDITADGTVYAASFSSNGSSIQMSKDVDVAGSLVVTGSVSADIGAFSSMSATDGAIDLLATEQITSNGIVVLGTVDATLFSGSGASLTSLPAANLTGTINVARLPTGTSANQIPILDGSGKLNTAVLPALAITETFPAASQAAMLALTAQQGDVAIRSDLNKSFILSTNSPTTLADWLELKTPTDAVLSVAGRTGAITLSSSDLSNNSDLAKYSAVTAAFSGTVSASAFSGNGNLITTIEASNITTGSLSDSRLSANVPLINAANSFTNQNTFAQGTITTSKPFTITQTWNASGVTFTGLLANFDTTTSASGSLLMDLQAVGVSKVSIDKSGNILSSGGNIQAAGSLIGARATSSGTNVAFELQNRSFTTTTPALNICNGTYSATTTINAVAAAITPTFNHASGAASSQALLINPVVTLLGSGTSSAALWIEPTGTQAASMRGMVVKMAATPTANPFEVLTSAGSSVYRITSTGAVFSSARGTFAEFAAPLFYTDAWNPYAGNVNFTINPPNNKGLVLTGGTNSDTGTATNLKTLQITKTYNQLSGTPGGTDLEIVRTETAVLGTHYFANFLVGSTSKFSVTNSGACTSPNRFTGNEFVQTSDIIAMDSGGLRLKSSSVITWGATTWYGTLDVGIARQAAASIRVTNGSTGVGSILVSGLQVTDLTNQKVDINYTNTGINIRSGDQYKFAASATTTSGGGDTGIARSAAATIKITNGSSGTGSLVADVVSANTVSATTVSGTDFTGTNGSIDIITAEEVNTNFLNISQSSPTSSSAGTPGDIAVDANYIYVCTASNVWKRIPLVIY